MSGWSFKGEGGGGFIRGSGCRRGSEATNRVVKGVGTWVSMFTVPIDSVLKLYQ